MFLLVRTGLQVVANGVLDPTIHHINIFKYQNPQGWVQYKVNGMQEVYQKYKQWEVVQWAKIGEASLRLSLSSTPVLSSGRPSRQPSVGPGQAVCTGSASIGSIPAMLAAAAAAAGGNGDAEPAGDDAALDAAGDERQVVGRAQSQGVMEAPGRSQRRAQAQRAQQSQGSLQQEGAGAAAAGPGPGAGVRPRNEAGPASSSVLDRDGAVAAASDPEGGAGGRQAEVLSAESPLVIPAAIIGGSALDVSRGSVKVQVSTPDGADAGGVYEVMVSVVEQGGSWVQLLALTRAAHVWAWH